jgi:hypothetical protein
VGRVELIDGNLIVTPNPDLQHQDLCVGLTTQLNSMVPGCPATCRIGQPI